MAIFFHPYQLSSRRKCVTPTVRRICLDSPSLTSETILPYLFVSLIAAHIRNIVCFVHTRLTDCIPTRPFSCPLDALKWIAACNKPHTQSVLGVSLCYNRIRMSCQLTCVCAFACELLPRTAWCDMQCTRYNIICWIHNLNILLCSFDAFLTNVTVVLYNW